MGRWPKEDKDLGTISAFMGAGDLGMSPAQYTVSLDCRVHAVVRLPPFLGAVSHFGHNIIFGEGRATGRRVRGQHSIQQAHFKGFLGFKNACVCMYCVVCQVHVSRCLGSTGLCTLGACQHSGQHGPGASLSGNHSNRSAPWLLIGGQVDPEAVEHVRGWMEKSV